MVSAAVELVPGINFLAVLLYSLSGPQLFSGFRELTCTFLRFEFHQ